MQASVPCALACMEGWSGDSSHRWTSTGPEPQPSHTLPLPNGLVLLPLISATEGSCSFIAATTTKKLQKAFANCPSLAHYHACVFAKHIAKPRLLKLLLRSVCATLQGSWSAHGEVIKWLLELGNGMQILGPPGYFFKKSWSVVTRS